MNIQQVSEMLKLILCFGRLCLSGGILGVCCNESFMTHGDINSVHYREVYAKKKKIVEYDTALISRILSTRKPYFNSQL